MKTRVLALLLACANCGEFTPTEGNPAKPGQVRATEMIESAFSMTMPPVFWREPTTLDCASRPGGAPDGWTQDGRCMTAFSHVAGGRVDTITLAWPARASTVADLVAPDGRTLLLVRAGATAARPRDDDGRIALPTDYFAAGGLVEQVSAAVRAELAP